MSISSPGVGSGLDVNTIVSKLMAIEQQPLRRLQQQETQMQSRISAFGKIQGALATLQDAAKALNDASLWKTAAVGSADANTVGAVSSGSAAPSSYSVSVQTLAQRQSLASTAFAAMDSTVGSGTLHIQLGAVSGGTFTADSARTQLDVSVGGGDTLANVRDKINAAAAGVSASIVSDASGARLVLRSTETGANQAFRITATDDDGDNTNAAGVSAFTFDPSTSGGGPTGNLTRNLEARDAAFKIDNLSLTSPTNRVQGALEGVTLELKKETGTASIEVQVTSDTEAMKKAVTRFTDAYNALNTLIKEQTRYDPASKSAGTLQGNSTAVGIQNQLRAILRQTMTTDSALSRLSDVGITAQRDGSLAVATSKLDAALADSAKVKALFATDDADNSRDGFSQRFSDLTTRLLGRDGAIDSATDSMQRAIRSLDSRQADIERRLESVRARLLRQYNQLDAQLGKTSQVDFSKLSTGNRD